MDALVQFHQRKILALLKASYLWTLAYQVIVIQKTE